MHTIHDSGYKKLFSNKTIFRQLLETFVSEAWVEEIDFEDCETIDKSFVSDHYKETESDLIYKVKLRGRVAYLIILLEFQSTVDRFMVLRELSDQLLHGLCGISGSCHVASASISDCLV